MVRLVSFCSTIILALALVLPAPIAAAGQRILSVYTWADYIDPDVVAEFEQEHDATIEFSYFDSNESRDKALTAGGGSGFDVLLVNEVQIGRYVKRGWVQPLDMPDMPHLANIDTRWKDAFDGVAARHGAAYFWGTLGIAWREDLYPRGVHSWRSLLEPDAELSGRIMMSGYGRELVGFALKADGHSVNTRDRALIRKAGERLEKQKPHVKSYGYPALTEESSLVSGDIWVSPMYSGDALMLNDIDENIRFRIPDEGGLLWVDYFTIASTSRQKALASAFLDFINRPHIAARNAEYVNYATPNLEALAFMSEEYLANPVIHPNAEQLNALEYFKPLPARSTKSINAVVSELRSD